MDKYHKALRDIIEELAEKDPKEGKREECIDKLHSLYNEGFRHLYSEIFATITRIDNTEGKSLDILAENMKSIYDESKNNSNLSEACRSKLMKLYDHINLDIARISYTKKISDDINAKNTMTNAELKQIKAQAGKMQKEYITILGIFSSIVLTFVAGIVFSSSVLSNIDKASIYRLVFIMLLIGLVLFNLINFLFEAIRETNGNVVNKNGDKPLISNINKIIISAMMLDFILWIIYWIRFS